MAEYFYSTDNDKYKRYEKEYGDSHVRKCIDGTFNGSNKCVGYCEYEEHPGFLTEVQRKNHQCILRECDYYVPKLPKLRSEKAKSVKYNSEEATKVIEIANRLLVKCDGMRVIRAKKDENNVWILQYVIICSEYELSSTAKRISKEVGCEIKFERLNYDFEAARRLIT